LSAVALPLRPRPLPAKPLTAGRSGRAMVAVVLVLLAAGLRNFNFAVTAVTLAGLIALIAGFRRPHLGLIGAGILCTVDALTRNFLLTGDLLRWNSYSARSADSRSWRWALDSPPRNCAASAATPT